MRKGRLAKDILIAREIEYRIEAGIYTEGDRLPSERKLAEEFKVQRGTVRSALRLLSDRGKIFVKRNSGHYVSSKRIDFNLNAYSSRKKVIERMGIITSAKLLTLEIIQVPEKILRKTGWEEGMMAYRIMRLRYANGVPMGVERTHIRRDLVPELTEEDVHNKSIYAFISREYDIHITESKTTVSAVYTNGLESELLNTRYSKLAVRYEGIVSDRKGRIVEYFDDILLKDKVQFVCNEVSRYEIEESREKNNGE